SEPIWNVQIGLSWVRFRDVAQACRFLERRDALQSLWRDGLETDELQQRLAGGDVRCRGMRDGVRHEIDPADWTRDGRTGLRLIRATEPYAARPGEKAAFTELRLARQQIQHAFPTATDFLPRGRSRAGARTVLNHTAPEMFTWDELWKAVSDSLGGAEVSPT